MPTNKITRIKNGLDVSNINACNEFIHIIEVTCEHTACAFNEDEKMQCNDAQR